MGFADVVLQKVRGTPAFKPASIDSFGDWSIEAGDIISVQVDGKTENIPVFSSDMIWSGAAKTVLSCTGNSEREVQDKETRKDFATASGFAGGLNSVKSDYVELVARVGEAEAGIRARVVIDDFNNYKEAQTQVIASLSEELQSTLDLLARDYVTKDEAGNTYYTKSAAASLTARVGEVESGLTLKADDTTVTALSGEVSTLQTAQAQLVTRVGTAESALKQKAESSTVTALDGRVSTLETAETSLTARVGEVESGLTSKVSTETFNTALSGKLGVQAATEIYAAKGDINAYIGAYVMANGKSLADIKADLVNITGMTTVSSGSFSVNGNINANGANTSIQALSGTVIGSTVAASNHFTVGGVEYIGTPITSTTGKSHNALGHT